MIRKFFSAMLVGVLALSISAIFAGCKDYDSDIDSLNQRLDANESAVSAIQSTLASGDWIKSVESIENGIKITLGSGKTYEITNGINGQTGAPGNVWTIVDGYWYKDGANTGQRAVPSIEIGPNGNWFINGVDTGVQAEGQNGTDGTDGTDGTNGTDGTDGADGTNGIDGTNGVAPHIGSNGNWWIGDTDTGVRAEGGDYYTPGADGYWYKNGEKTDLKWMADGVVTAIIDQSTGKMLLYSNGEVIELSMNTAALRSLVFAPQGYVSGVPAILIDALKYSPMNTSTDGFINSSNFITTSKQITASYYMNPSSVPMSGIDTDNLEFIVDNVPFYTRAAQGVTASYLSNSNGLLTVEVKGNFADIESETTIDILALKVPTKKLDTNGITDDAENGFVTSDFATLYKANNLLQEDLAICNPTTSGTSKYHYPTKLATVTSTTTVAPVQGTFAWDGTLNLLDYVITFITDDPTATSCLSTLPVLDLPAYGLAYKFDISSFVYNVSLNGEQATNQQSFITWDNEEQTVVKARVYNDPAGTAAIGRTPVVRVTITDTNNSNNVVAIGYIKLQITEVEENVSDTEFDWAFTPALKPTCATSYTPFLFNTPDMNTVIYNPLGLSKQQFHTRYEIQKSGDDVEILTPVGVNGVTGPFLKAGTVTEVSDTDNSDQTTFNLKWTITPTEVWQAIQDGKSNYKLAARVVYVPKTGYEYLGKVYIEFYTTIDASSITGVSVPASYLLPNYWDNSTTPEYFKLNVAIPTDPVTAVNEIFEADLWLGFDEPKVKAIFGSTFTNTDFAFEFATPTQSPIAGKTITVSSDKLSLLVGTVKVAEIDGTILKFVNNTTSQALLETGQFFAAVQMYATVCSGYKINLTGYANFKALFIRPLEINNVSDVYFQDGQDGGSTLEAKKVVGLKDWRGISFETKPGYYTWYGVTDFVLDSANATCNLGAGQTIIPLSSTGVKITVSGSGLDTTYTYNNNGANVLEDFEIYLPITVKYYWGEIEETITITVKSTL